MIEYEDFEYNPEVGELNYAWNVYLKSDPETAFDGDLIIHEGEGDTVVFSFCSPDHYMGVRVDEQKESF